MFDSNRWLVFGAGGMLGREIVQALRAAGREVLALRRADADVTNLESIAPHVRNGDIVVNCAAWTRVDAAEFHPEEAHQLNAEGPANLALACARAGGRLVHFSTDYVFGDATAGTPIPVDAPYSPTCVYGATKVVGEQRVREILGDDALIVRIAWLYGEHGQNFVRTILSRLESGQPLRVVNDQWGQPTWARDVAHASILLVDAKASGTYHLTNSGQSTWYEFACAIAANTGHDSATIEPVSSTEYPTPARRPNWSVLANVTDSPMRPWREALAEFLS